MSSLFRLLFLLISVMVLNSCVTTPAPSRVDNVCRIFEQYPKWYWAAKETEEQWGVPVAVQMAIINQESSFKAKAKPPRRRLLGFIPWFRPSSAYGYSQALKQTWKDYCKKTGNCDASRKNFHDAVDFIGWYANQVSAKLHVSKSNAYVIYLSYHEGIGGFQQRSYANKPWLINVAKNVAWRAKIYQQQLAICQDSLPKRHFWNIWY